MNVRQDIEQAAFLERARQQPCIFEVAERNGAVSLRPHTQTSAQQAGGGKRDGVLTSNPRWTRLKYCAIMGAAGRLKFREKEYSTEPR